MVHKTTHTSKPTVDKHLFIGIGCLFLSPTHLALTPSVLLRPLFWPSFQRHNSPADWVRVVLKLSTDSASLQVRIEKKFVSDLGFSVGDVTNGACFRLFDQVHLALGANPTGHYFAWKFFWKPGYNQRLWSPWLVCLLYLEPKLWLKNPIFDKNMKVKQKVLFAISGQTLPCHNSTADWARELLKPSKNSWNLFH